MNEYLIDTLKIGKAIQLLRKKNHLTQDELADLVGYSTRTILRIETCCTSDIVVINSFAESFKVSAISILSGML